MTIIQIVAYYVGVLITSSIIFFILRAVFVAFLEKKHKNNFLATNPEAKEKEIGDDFKIYFKKIRRKLYITLVIIVIIIYLIISK